jgi:hypothetical protein
VISWTWVAGRDRAESLSRGKGEMGKVERRVDVWTDCGEFVLFERDELAKHAGRESDWCTDDDVQLAVANAGVAVFVAVGQDGGFRFRLTTGALTPDEQRAIRQVERGFWLDVKGHELIVGGLEVVPNAEDGEELYIDEEEYERIRCEPGRYHVEVYRLVHGDVDPELRPMRLPHYVVRLVPFAAGEDPPRLSVLPALSTLQSDP